MASTSAVPRDVGVQAVIARPGSRGSTAISTGKTPWELYNSRELARVEINERDDYIDRE